MARGKVNQKDGQRIAHYLIPYSMNPASAVHADSFLAPPDDQVSTHRLTDYLGSQGSSACHLPAERPGSYLVRLAQFTMGSADMFQCRPAVNHTCTHASVPLQRLSFQSDKGDCSQDDLSIRFIINRPHILAVWLGKYEINRSPTCSLDPME